MAILGLGQNGHVAFHEPSLNTNFFSGCLKLDLETTKRLGLEPETRVVSYGLNAFLKSKAILLIVRGETKKTIFTQVMQANCKLPAAFLLKHYDVTVVVDFKVSN